MSRPTLALLAALAAAPVAGQAAETVVSVRKVVLPSGGRYFALPVRIGSKQLTAAIDTGSAGLRVLTRALDPGDARATGRPSSLTFGSGTTIAGAQAVAEVGFGALHGPVRVEIIERLSCAEFRPNCAEGHLPIGEMGLMGGGVPGQGAPAIIGLARSDIPVTVPFPALGVPRWIVDIPNDAEDGRIVLDPPPQALQGFVRFPAPIGPDGKPAGAIRGCLQNDASGERVCGLVVFDTGAAGISVSSNGRLPVHWPAGTPASLLYQDDDGHTRLIQRFRTGDPAHSSRLSFDHRADANGTVIHANASPYLCFDILYEADRSASSLRPRRAGPADPHAFAAN